MKRARKNIGDGARRSPRRLWPWTGDLTASLQVSTFDPLIHRLAAFCIIILGTLSFVSAADTTGFEKEKNPPEPGLITRLRRQEEAQKKQAEYDVRVAVPDIDAAQSELEGLNNTVSNALYMAEQSKRANEADEGVFKNVLIAAVILGAGILFFRKFGPRLGVLFNTVDEVSGGSPVNRAEAKSFSEFATAFKVGPTPHRCSSSPANEFTLNESLKTGEFLSVTLPPLKVFFDKAPKAVSVMRSLIQEITRAPELVARQKLLVNLCEKIQDFKGMAGLPEVLPVWQLAVALEGLVKQLTGKDRNVTPSTLRTVASAVDLLEALSAPGIRADLLSEPPVRFLAVDDDSISRHAVSFALKKALNKPDLAENGEAALALVSHIKYDAIFLDVQMPGMNGFEVCSNIHRTELNGATPVIFVTCQSDFDARAKSTLSGGVDLIGKPFLTFEITVKALTLALRGRLKSEAEPLQQLDDKKSTAAVETSWSSSNSTQELAPDNEPAHKSREERRRDRRKIAHARQSKKNRGRRGKSQSNNGRHDGDSFNLSSDLVANAFLAHAPANIEMLRDRVEHIYEATDDAFRQEILVELYLAVHSLTAEASLAKLETFSQLSAAIEALLKKLVEEQTHSIISSLSVVAGALDLLHDFCDAKLTANLAEKPMGILIVGHDVTARENLQNRIQLQSATFSGAGIDEALDLITENSFDTIVLDIESADANTVSTCSKLREQSKSKPAVLFLSNEADSEILLQSINHQDRLVHKPGSPAEISLGVLTSVLSTRLDQLTLTHDSGARPPAQEFAASEK